MNSLRFGRSQRRPYQVYSELITEARAAAKRHGHIMGNAPLQRHYTDYRNYDCYKMTGIASCKKCGMSFVVTTLPAPNDAYVTGEAVALDCTGERKI